MKRFLFGALCACLATSAGAAVDLGKMAQEYNDNQIVFNKKYAQGPIEFDAKIDGVTSDAYTDIDDWGNVTDMPGLELNPIDEVFSIMPTAVALMADNDDLDDLKRGQLIRLRCNLFVPEFGIVDLYFKDCEIVKVVE